MRFPSMHQNAFMRLNRPLSWWFSARHMLLHSDAMAPHNQNGNDSMKKKEKQKQKQIRMLLHRIKKQTTMNITVKVTR